MMMTQNDDDAGTVRSSFISYVAIVHNVWARKQVFNDEHFLRPDIGHTTLTNQLEGYCYIIGQ